MNKLLIATRNQGKLKEISQFLSDLPIKTLSLSDMGIEDEFEEKGKTYKENSRNKAIFYAKKSAIAAIADDGGIEITALGGGPGVKSRRWIGKNSTDEKIIDHMKKLSLKISDNKREAFFKTVISFALPNGQVWSSYGQVKGIIAKKPHLKLLKGYPYRSFFYLPKIRKYYHENDLTADEQKLYNHRYKAIQKLKPIITRELIIRI
ncbi:MAG: non-canonical purine NTP pyrophosphatase [Candidatus Levybacteria bacterium]|nr:non-canonical purine NTP pyrophosphatase [Candidatus Levybacteria bacterium]